MCFCNLADTVCNGNQAFVALLMPVIIIVLLEIIHIQYLQSKAVPTFKGMQKQLIRLYIELSPVCHACKRICLRLRRKTLILLLHSFLGTIYLLEIRPKLYDFFNHSPGLELLALRKLIVQSRSLQILCTHVVCSVKSDFKG